MMNHNLPRICVFAGTSEGRRLIQNFSRTPISITACVATEYGEILLENQDNLVICQERMNQMEMEAFFETAAFDLIIDATHPFATAVTANLRNACIRKNQQYLRLVRDSQDSSADVVCETIDEAVGFLAGTKGPVFLTTGSKDLHKFAADPALRERLFVRILPVRDSLEECSCLGILPGRIMALQGPFTREHNRAAFEWAGAKYVVTKESGKSGGLEEKLQAAKDIGATTVMIGRPDEEGMSYEQVIGSIKSRLSLQKTQKVYIIGMGPGRKDCLTLAGTAALKSSQYILGPQRLLEMFPEYREKASPLFNPEKVRDFILARQDIDTFALLVSGDTGFFSNAKGLAAVLAPIEAEILPGISSAAYLAARLKIPWEDGFFSSLHGRSPDFAAIVNSHEKTFFLLGGRITVADFARHLLDYQLDEVQITIGENLSYPDETITTGSPGDFTAYVSGPLPLAMVINRRCLTPGTTGLSDQAFLRGNIPMTKEEVRVLSIAKLGLEKNSILYDIGAGTGSISVAAARAFPFSRVYAIEEKAEGISLIGQNSRKFHTDNLHPVHGTAPAAFTGLPAPTHAFIGGSRGRMEEIIRYLVTINPGIAIVINTVTLESLAEVTQILKDIPFAEQDIVSVTTARSKQAGRYHLMEGLNPIYIISLKGFKNGKGACEHA